MSKHPNDLMRMLRLFAGQLPGDEAQQMRERMRNDARLRKLWSQIQAAAGDDRLHLNGHEQNGLERNDKRLSPGTNHLGGVDSVADDRFSAETIAAFVEERLAADQAVLFEQACLATQDLFEEVVATFQFTCQPPTVADKVADANLTQRLLRMGDWRDAADKVALIRPPATNVTQTQAVQIKADSSVVSRRISNKKWSPVFVVVLVAIAASILALVAAATYFFAGNDKRQIADPHQLEPSSQDDLAKHDEPHLNNPKDEIDGEKAIARENSHDNDRQDDVEHRDEPLQAPRFPKLREPMIAENPDRTLSTDDDLNDDELMKRPAREVESPELRDQYAAIKPQWIRIEGVVAARRDDESLWRGAQYEQLDDDTRNWTTLPESWGSAALGELGQLVMDEDTSIRLTQARMKNRIVVELQRGRVAFRNLPARTELQIRTVDHVWNAANIDEDSTVGIDIVENKPRLQVRKGRLDVDGLEVKQDQQIVWDKQRKENLTGKLPENAAWIDKPVRVARMSEKNRQALLTSGNLLANLHEIQDSNSLTNRSVATKWSFALAPETDLYTAWNSDKPDLRAAAFEWLMNGDLRDPRARQAWGGIARATDSPRIVRQIVDWIRLARDGARMESEQATLMLALLDHDEVIFRQFAAFFLEAAFGNPFDYNPDAERRVRQQVVRLWKARIRQVYNQRQADQRPQQKIDTPNNRPAPNKPSR